MNVDTDLDQGDRQRVTILKHRGTNGKSPKGTPSPSASPVTKNVRNKALLPTYVCDLESLNTLARNQATRAERPVMRMKLVVGR